MSDEVVLAVTDSSGRDMYRSTLLGGSVGDRAESDQEATGESAQALADGELAAAGWVRDGHWVPAASPSGIWVVTASVTARPRVPVTPQDHRAVLILERLTVMARGPVTAAALVPQVAPTWQAAATQLRRLVAAGQVRGVGRTTGGRISRTLYAPVGSQWAPERAAPPSP